MDDDEFQGALSLYFELKPGRNADLEIISQSAIHWAATLRAAAQQIDPSAIIRIELVDAEEGSLRLNTILDWAEGQLEAIENGAIKHWRLKKLAVALAAFAVVSGVPTYQYYFGDKPTVELSEEDRARLDQLLELVQDKPPVEASRKKFFKSLEKDPSIKGVGITEDRKAKPNKIIPSSEFAQRGGLWAIEDEELERTLWPVLDVTLIGPVLVKKPRSWRFRPEGLPEFSATMRDERFLAALEEDHVRERLRIGIPMTIRLKVEEKKEAGVWVGKRGGRSVAEVISPKIT